MKKTIIIPIFFILIIGILNIFSINCSCSDTLTNTFYVGGNGEGNYSKIQDAINNSLDGDVILVFPGTYNESIFINKSIDIIAQNKGSTEIIGKKNIFDVITINGVNINVTGFTIKGGLVSGILIKNSENCNIYQNIIDSNYIGINIFSSNNLNIFENAIINNSVIGLNIDCSIGFENPFIDLYSSSGNTINHNNFINNTQHVNDNCTNYWSNNNEGNYFDDYIGLDKNKDGIGDTAYEIPGGENIDEFPLMNPYNGSIEKEKFIVDYDSVFKMLIIGIIISIFFVLPIAYFWRKKYFL